MPKLRTEVLFREDVRLTLGALYRTISGMSQLTASREADAYRQGFIDALRAVDTALGPGDAPVWRIANGR